MILLQNYHIHHSLPPRWTAHLRGGWGEPGERCSLWSHRHLSRSSSCCLTTWEERQQVHPIVSFRGELSPSQAETTSPPRAGLYRFESLPRGTWGSLQGETLSPTPETTHPLTPGPAQPAQVSLAPCLWAVPLPNPARDAPEAAEGLGGGDGGSTGTNKLPRLLPMTELGRFLGLAL